MVADHIDQRQSLRRQIAPPERKTYGRPSRWVRAPRETREEQFRRFVLSGRGSEPAAIARYDWRFRVCTIGESLDADGDGGRDRALTRIRRRVGHHAFARAGDRARAY